MLTALKREAYEVNATLPRNGLVHLTIGNASAIDRQRGMFAFKPRLLLPRVHPSSAQRAPQSQYQGMRRQPTGFAHGT